MTGWDARPTGRQVAVRTFKSSWAVVQAMPLLLLGTLAIYIALNIGMTEISRFLPANFADLAAWPDSPWPTPPLYVDLLPVQGLEMLCYFLEAWIIAPFEIAFFRLILLGDTEFSLSPFAPLVRRYAAWTFAGNLLFLPLTQLLFLPEPWLWAFFPACIFAALAMAWLTFVFPTLAIEASDMRWSDRVRLAAHQLKGNYWLLVRASLLVMGLFVVFIIFQVAVFWEQTLIEQGRVIMSWRYQAVEALWDLSLVVTGTAVTAWVYAWAVPSTKQSVAEAFD